MNRPLFRSLLAVAGACLFANCAATTPGGRIEQHPSKYQSLSSRQKEAVEKGELLEGMNKDAVYLAWGRPNGIKEGSASGKALEKWRYVGHRPVITNHFNAGFGYGRGYGRHCDTDFYNYGQSIDYIPYTAAVVEFRNGKVTGWERER